MPSRSLEVLSLAGLLLGAVAVLAIAVAFPMSERAPVTLGYVMLGVAAAMAVFTIAAGDRLPRWALLVEAIVAALLNSVLVAAAHTQGGAIADAFAYAWLTVYVAVFFPSAATLYALMEGMAYGVGLAVSGLPQMATAWAVIGLSTVVLAGVLGRVSRVVRRHLHTDPLTGALNRVGLEAAGAALLARARRRGERVSAAALDEIAGDGVLAETVATWRATLRGEDVLARAGGDGFVVLMPATSPEGAQSVVGRLRSQSPAACSAGIAEWRPGEPLHALVGRAGEELRAAKARRVS